MPRIRTIKPEFFSSPGNRGTSPWARILYQAMWCWADDSGRGTANVRELAAFAFPDDEDEEAPTVTELPTLLAEVQRAYSVVFYRVDGRRYYAITSWERHNRNERRAKSRYPGPDEGESYDPGPSEQAKPQAPTQRVATPTQPHGTSVSTHGASVAGTGEQGNRGTGDSAPSERAANRRAPQPPLIDDDALGEPPDDDEHVVGDWDPDASPRPELALVHDSSKAIEAAEPKVQTRPQRIQALTAAYYEAVDKQTNFAADRKIIEKFVDRDHADQQIHAALMRLVTEHRPLTATALRFGLNGGPKRRGGSRTPSERAAATLACDDQAASWG